jgi:uncharacterized delta-60 repeat protein
MGLGHRVLWIILSTTALSVSPVSFGFGTDGFSVTSFDGFFDSVHSLHVDGENRMTEIGFSFDTKKKSLEIALSRSLSDGKLDPTFGIEGKTRFGVQGTDGNFILTKTVQADGKLVVAGGAQVGEDRDFLIARILPNGSLDPTFGKKGAITLDVNFGSEDAVKAITTQPNGKIVVVGTTTINEELTDTVIARLLPDGSLDRTFGNGGMTTLVIGKRGAAPSGLLLQKNGNLVIVDSGKDVHLIQVNSLGQLDRSFGVDGVATTLFASNRGVCFTGAQLQSDGKIVAAGFTVLERTSFIAARYLPEGILDKTFGKEGIQIVDIASGPDVGKAVAIQNDGKIVIAGSSAKDKFQSIALVRLLPDGTLDETFGEKGKLIAPLSGRSTQSQDVALQMDGKIVVAGDGVVPSVNANGLPNLFVLARFLPDGKLDRP